MPLRTICRKLQSLNCLGTILLLHREARQHYHVTIPLETLHYVFSSCVALPLMLLEVLIFLLLVMPPHVIVRV